jgi:hypothetical protein
MKKVNELEIKRTAFIREMDELQRNATMTEDQTRSWDDKKVEVEKLNKEIERAKAQDELNKMIAGEAIRNEDDGEKKDIVKSFFRAAQEYTNTNGRVISNEFIGSQGGLKIPVELLRADPILTTTNTSLVPVNVQNSLSMVTGDDFSLLRALGVPFYTGLTGTTELPYMVQLNTSKPTEGGDASTANAAPLNVELKPQTYSTTQSWSKMSLLNMPNSIYTGILGDMQLANERQVVTDFFSSITATDSSILATASGLSYGDMINLTNINYNIGNAKFVVDNNIRVYLEQKPVSTAGSIALCWNALNNTVGGRQAIASYAMQSKRAVYGNFGFGAVGEWGTPELVINGLTTPGKLAVTVLGFYKPVVRNKYAFKYFGADVSCAI